MSSEFRTKGPRTYRKLYPDAHVLAIVAVAPNGDDLLFEGPVTPEFYKQVINLYFDFVRQKEKERDAVDAADSLSPFPVLPPRPPMS